MLIEASEHDFFAFRRIFEQSRIKSEITRYARAEQALERLSVDAGSFDLVVTEYRLPGLSGMEFYRELTQRNVLLPVVLMSGSTNETLPIEAFKAGFDDFLMKNSEQGYLELLPALLLDIVRKYHYREKVKQEAAENKQQAPHAAIIEDLQEMVCRCFPDKTLSYVNDAICRFFNLQREALLGQCFPVNVHDEDKEKVKQHLDALRPENPVGKIEHRVVLPSGEVRWQQWSNHAIFDEKGVRVEFQSVGWDTTAQKKVENGLHESEERYRVLVESVLDGFFVCEFESGGFLLINKKACDLLGYPMQEILQGAIGDVMSADEQAKMHEEIRSRTESGALRPFRGTYTLRRKDGSDLKTEVSVSLAFFKGTQVIQGIFRRLAEQEDPHLQLDKAYKLEGVVTLAAGIAHHIDNALAGITENIGRLESDFPENETLSAYVEPMYGAAGQVSRLSAQLLGYAGSRRPQRKIISLNDTVEDAIALVLHIMDPAIQIETLLAEDIADVENDPFQIQTALSAVLTRLAELIDGPSRIKIITKMEAVHEDPSEFNRGLKPGQYACLEVEVGGEAVDKFSREKMLEYLSSPFRQGKGSDGTAVSETETGVKVSFYLPVTETKGRLGTRPPQEAVDDKEFILVVEDDETGMGITRTMLEKLGFHVLEARTGMEAIYLVKSFGGTIRLVFLDSVLADMGGLEVYTLLVEILPNTKVIVLGGYENDALVRRILDAGAQTVIEKPFTLDTLRAKIAAILEEK